MVAVGKTDIDPFQGAVGLIVQHLPVNVVGHQKRGVFLHVHGNGEMLDLIGGLRSPRCQREGGSEAQDQSQQKRKQEKRFSSQRGVRFGSIHQQYLLRGHSPVIWAE